MKFVKFFRDLAKYLYKTDNLNYDHIKQILAIMLRNMTDKEKAQYNYYFFKCLSSIHKQLTIPEFIKELKQDG